MAETEFSIGDVVRAAGSCGVLLDIYTNANGKRVYKIHFVKNAVRFQPPETHPEEVLVRMTKVTVADMEEEIRLYKERMDEELDVLRSQLPNTVSLPLAAD